MCRSHKPQPKYTMDIQRKCQQKLKFLVYQYDSPISFISLVVSKNKPQINKLKHRFMRDSSGEQQQERAIQVACIVRNRPGIVSREAPFVWGPRNFSKLLLSAVLRRKATIVHHLQIICPYCVVELEFGIWKIIFYCLEINNFFVSLTMGTVSSTDLVRCDILLFDLGYFMKLHGNSEACIMVVICISFWIFGYLGYLGYLDIGSTRFLLFLMSRKSQTLDHLLSLIIISYII